MTQTSGLSAMRGARRRVLTGPDQDLVRLVPCTDGATLPQIIEPTVPGVDLVTWAESHFQDVQTLIHKHGALLFRRFGVSGVGHFEDAAAALAGELFGDYGDLPREKEGGDKIFGSTPYPNDEMIYWHSESAHMAHWPMRIFFHSVVAAETGGETPLVDIRQALVELDPAVIEELDRRGLLYSRNFAPGIDVPWQQFFRTDNRAAVEARCAETNTIVEWHSDGNLRIKTPLAAITIHPHTGERVFFNQVLLHHPAALPAKTRAALSQLFSDEEMPRNLYFGDGGLIPDGVIAHVLDTYRRISVAERWQIGDVMMLDNMLTCHGRNPFTGARKILVAMGQMV